MSQGNKYVSSTPSSIQFDDWRCSICNLVIRVGMSFHELRLVSKKEMQRDIVCCRCYRVHIEKWAYPMPKCNHGFRTVGFVDGAN